MSLLDNLQSGYFRRKALFAICFISVIQLVGLVGLNVGPYRNIFENLSAISLLLSFFAVIFFQSPKSLQFLIFCCIAFILGMAAEICGVSTGYPFGIYHYTPTLGPGFHGVPLIIGLNWILLSYTCAIVVYPYFVNKWFIVSAASILMVLTDLLLEGFAIRHHLWVWQNGLPPLQNYLSWFFISLIMQVIFMRLMRGADNIMAKSYLLILWIFLGADWLIAMVI